eukprot:7156642-Ditylum_brightwellii.AAC.1
MFKYALATASTPPMMHTAASLTTNSTTNWSTASSNLSKKCNPLQPITSKLSTWVRFQANL